MYRYLRYLAVIFVMAPAMVFGRQAPQLPSQPTPLHTPCPGTAMVVPGIKPYVQPSANVNFDAEKRKTFEKTYKVNSADILNIDNRYGRVHVNTWNKNEIKVKVDMIARAGSDNKATDMLNRMKVEESKDGNTIFLKTVYELSGVSGPSSSEINYTVYMPEANGITLKNKYGDVYLAALKGKVDVDVKYGNLKCDRLNNVNNTLKLAYGSGSCGYINGGNVQIAYFDMNVAEAKELKGFSKYSELTIGTLNEELNMDMKYGSFRVNNISSNVRNIRLASTYIPISLNFADKSAFNFNVNVQYGDFKVRKDLVNMTTIEKDYTSAGYKGKFGSAASKAAVSITSKYGDVRFTQ